jgi:hypothetical protein
VGEWWNNAWTGEQGDCFIICGWMERWGSVVCGWSVGGWRNAQGRSGGAG